MVSKRNIAVYLAALAALLSTRPGFAADGLVDSASLEAGAGSKVQMLRFAVQSDWNRHWLPYAGYHVSGYWDASIAYWRGNAYRNMPGRRQNLAVAGITPVFRWERDDKRGFYAEGGIGANLFSHLYNNDDNRLSTAFEFGDHIGVGWVFENRWDLGVKIQHYSNGGIKHPNSGVNWFVVKAAYPF